MTGALFSIRPFWVFKIVLEEKLWEIRKKKPKLKPPFKCFIYMTKNGSKIAISKENYAEEMRVAKLLSYGCGKVVGEFVCDKIQTIFYYSDILYSYKCPNDYMDKMCKETGLTLDNLKKYANGDDIYALHVSNLKIYDKPKEIFEFKKPCIDKYNYCQACKYGNISIPDDEQEYALYHGGNYTQFEEVCTNYLTTPPQSMCYVEDCV